MKTKSKLKFLGILSAGVFAIYSCTKQNDVLPAKANSFFNNGEVAKLNAQLENSADAEDEKMNDNLLMLSTAFASISDNSELMGILYTQASSNEGYVKYSDLIAADSRFQTLLDVELGDLYCPAPLGEVDDPYEAIEDSMIYKSVQYYPAIYVPNFKTGGVEETPYVCVGAEIDDYDNILSFKLDEHSDIQEGTLTEAEALAATPLVVIFTNGTDHIETTTESPSYSEESSEPPSTASDEIWKWDEVTIHPGYRYEGVGKSEVRCLTTFSKSDGSYLSGGGSFQNGVEESLIKKITNTDIANNTTQTGVNADVFPHAGTVSTTNLNYYNYAYLTTYEYDWYASPKIVSSCGTLFSVSGFRHTPRMKYSNEWYSNSVCEITVHNTWLNYVNATFSFGNFKSLTKIKRTQ